jgi:mono/diheme cytochrome c family protein
MEWRPKISGSDTRGPVDGVREIAPSAALVDVFVFAVFMHTIALSTHMRAFMLASLVVPVMLAAQAAETRSVRDGVYSASQANRGEKIYRARCQQCHQIEQFVGPVFMKSWHGTTADALYDAIRTTMPTDNPGGLKPQEYADLVAYLFKMNRLPSGESELKATKAALKQVRIEQP